MIILSRSSPSIVLAASIILSTVKTIFSVNICVPMTYVNGSILSVLSFLPTLESTVLLAETIGDMLENISIKVSIIATILLIVLVLLNREYITISPIL